MFHGADEFQQQRSAFRVGPSALEIVGEPSRSLNRSHFDQVKPAVCDFSFQLVSSVHERRREVIGHAPGVAVLAVVGVPRRIFTKYGSSIVPSVRPSIRVTNLQTTDTNIRPSGRRTLRAFWRTIIRSLRSLRWYSGPINNTVLKDASPCVNERASPMLIDAMGFPGWFLEASIA